MEHWMILDGHDCLVSLVASEMVRIS